MHRYFHDTGRWRRLPTRLDDRGVQRGAQNKRVETLVDEAFDADFKFRGDFVSPIPPYVERARAALMQTTGETVEEYATSLNVKETTAWCYLCQVVERYPETHVAASAFVHPTLLSWLRDRDDLDGPLRGLWERCDRGDPELRCLSNLFAHLRLGRLCVQEEAVTSPGARVT